MEIEKSLDEAAALISKCWDLRNNPNDLGVCRVKIQTLVSDMIEQSQIERGAFPVTEQVIQKLAELVRKFDELEAKLDNHKSAIDAVIANAVQSDRK
ncbi:hypothetical protein N9V38_01130 [Planktomarina temperata]|nr:hypothetical protein [Planktomarina temperata]